MSEIIIQPQNPLALTEEDLRGYVEEVRKNLPQIEVQFDEGQRMPAGVRAVTWWEVVRVYLSDIPADIRGIVVAELLRIGYHWAKQRFRINRLKNKRRDTRPKAIIVHGADRQEEGSMVLRSARHKPITVEEFRKQDEERLVKHSRKRNRSRKASPKKKKRKS